MSDNDEDGIASVWWGKLFLAIVMFGVAVLTFMTFRSIESGETESVRMPWYIVVGYYIGGKWVVAGLFTLFGILLTFAGIQQLRTGEAD